eukprot:3068409-Pleurochrysis_carterae.AAC.1
MCYSTIEFARCTLHLASGGQTQQRSSRCAQLRGVRFHTLSHEFTCVPWRLLNASVLAHVTRPA